jgi:hypothetical protein
VGRKVSETFARPSPDGHPPFNLEAFTAAMVPDDPWLALRWRPTTADLDEPRLPDDLDAQLLLEDDVPGPGDVLI